VWLWGQWISVVGGCDCGGSESVWSVGVTVGAVTQCGWWVWLWGQWISVVGGCDCGGSESVWLVTVRSWRAIVIRCWRNPCEEVTTWRQMTSSLSPSLSLSTSTTRTSTTGYDALCSPSHLSSTHRCLVIYWRESFDSGSRVSAGV